MNRSKMIIAAMSDLHGYLPKTELPLADVYCICGDIVPLDVQSDMVSSIAWLCTQFFPWVESLPCEKVFLVAGNHDFIFEYLGIDRNGQHRKPKRVLQKLMAPSKLTLLEDTEVMYKGYRFYGAPWCPDLSRWAFYKPSGELSAKFNKIPEGTDVLMTHCPPALNNFGTVLQQDVYNYGAKYGSHELADAISNKVIAPRLNIFGHVHTGQHLRATYNGTTFANVSLKDENYSITYDIQTFELS